MEIIKEVFSNISYFCSEIGTIGSETFKFIFNNGSEVKVPLPIATLLTKNATVQYLLNEPYQTLNIPLRKSESVNYISELLKGDITNFPNDVMSPIYNDIVDFALSIKNIMLLNCLVKPYLNISRETSSYKEILTRYTYEFKLQSLGIKDLEQQYNEDCEFLSSHFYELCENSDFILWCKDHQNIHILEKIITNDKLVIETEDQLLKFILKLCNEDLNEDINEIPIYASLLEHVMYEYCSSESLDTLQTYLHKVDFFTQLPNQLTFVDRIINSLKITISHSNTFNKN